MKKKYLTKLRPLELQIFIKKILRFKRKHFKTPDGRVYWIDTLSNLGMSLESEKSYEIAMSNTINDILGKGKTFIDIGANEGYFTILGSKLCGNEGKVISFEPQKKLLPIIMENIFSNSCCNVQLLPYGVGSNTENLKLQLFPDINSGAASFSTGYNFKMSFKKIRQRLYGFQISKVFKLDDLKDSLPNQIDLIKIDIEGFEYYALEGMKEILKERRVKNLLIELHHDALASMGLKVENISKFLSSENFIEKKIESNLNLYTLLDS